MRTINTMCNKGESIVFESWIYEIFVDNISFNELLLVDKRE